MSAAGDPSGVGGAEARTTTDARGGADTDVLARLFDGAPFVVSLHEGPDHLYRFTNRLGHARMGGKPYLGRPFRAVWPSLALMGTCARYDQAFASGQAVAVPTFRVPPMPADDPGDPPRWVRQNLYPWRGADGSVRGVVSLTHDAEAEAEAAQAERRAALRLGAALDASAIVGVWDWDVKGGTVHADSGLAALFGLEGAAEAGALTADQFADAMHPEDRERVFARMDRTAREGGDYADEFRTLTPGGGVRFVQVVGHRGQGNEDEGVIHGLTFDVTAKREAEAAVIASEARLDAALRAADLGVFELEETGAVCWDARARALWGFGPDEAVTTEAVWARIHPDDADALRGATDAAVARARTAADGAARYELRHRVVRGGDEDGNDVVWIRATGTVHCRDGRVARVIGIVADASEQEAQRFARSLSLQELSHRLRNTLTIVQAIAAQTFRGVAGAAEPLRVFMGRLQAFAASQTDLAEDGGRGGDLEGVIHRAVDACAPTGRITIEGPPVRLDGRGAQMTALAVHELCTNASKYGALSVPEGRVGVRWTREGASVRLVWTETGGPPVTPPVRRGFGTTLIEQAASGQARGGAALDYRPEGLVCTLTFEAEAEAVG